LTAAAACPSLARLLYYEPQLTGRSRLPRPAATGFLGMFDTLSDRLELVFKKLKAKAGSPSAISKSAPRSPLRAARSRRQYQSRPRLYRARQIQALGAEVLRSLSPRASNQVRRDRAAERDGGTARELDLRSSRG